MIRVQSRAASFAPPEEALKRIFAEALARYGGERDPDATELDLALVDDTEIARLNAAYKGREGPTDVLAFADGEPEPGGGPVHLGDVAVSVETARREAAGRGMRVADEILLYAAHGILHLLGFDDHAPRDIAAMRAAEREVLAAVGVEPRWD